MKTSLFGHLAYNFVGQTENLATEALAYILNRSHTARDALYQLCKSTGAAIPTDLSFQTQVTDDDGAKPDLVGASLAEPQAVIIEAKFWAGLTDNQPVTYLNRGPNLLLFVAPAKRLPTLWPELLSRSIEAGFSAMSSQQVLEEFCVVQLSEKLFMAATSWRRLLDSLVEALASSGDLEAVGDAHQLRGLCDQMDSHAFMPLRSEELSPSVAIRSLQLNEIIDDATEELVSLGKVSVTRLRATPRYEGYIRYMRMGDFAWILQVNTVYWSTIRETPLWLSVKGIPETGDWGYSSEAHRRLSKLELENPPRLIRRADDLLVPLRMPLGVEKSKVVRSIVGQLLRVEELLSNGSRP
jgi:hypothetical protein